MLLPEISSFSISTSAQANKQLKQKEELDYLKLCFTFEHMELKDMDKKKANQKCHCRHFSIVKVEACYFQVVIES